jgi:hypothetical protein
MSALKKIREKTELKSTRFPHLKVIKGGRSLRTRREKRIEQFWLFCQATFWNTQLFSDAQVTEFKTLIGEHFKESKNSDKTFKKLVERVCLAKRYVTRKQGRYVSKPVDWLNINYKNGLTATASWYEAVEEQRKTVPNYNEGILILAGAMLNYCKRRNILDILHYRKQLIDLKQYDLLQIYMNSILHIDYLNL